MPTFASRFNLSSGHILPGLVIDQTTFVTVISTAQLFHLAPDPRLSEDERSRKRDRVTANLAELRREVQRVFKGAKSKNVTPYAHYLVSTAKGQPGIAPPIMLWTPDPLQVEEGDREMSRAQIPFDKPLVAIDGETQLAARYEAANLDEATLQERVPIVICHGKSLAWARQVFHDVNTFGIRPNAAVAVSMDERDPVTVLAREVANDVPFFRGRVSFTQRQLRKTDHEVITIATLRSALLAMVGGTPALQKGAKLSDLSPETSAHVRDVAVEWFAALSQVLNGVLEDRDKLASTAPAWVAFGVLGHDLLPMDGLERKQRIADYMNQLQSVKWDRSEAWSGIIGKMGANASFSLGSAKEVVHQLTRALADPSDPGYERVRAAA